MYPILLVLVAIGTFWGAHKVFPQAEPETIIKYVDGRGRPVDEQTALDYLSRNPPAPPPRPVTTTSSSYTPYVARHSPTYSDRVHVRGYYRKDGTYVRPHTRRRSRR